MMSLETALDTFLATCCHTFTVQDTLPYLLLNGVTASKKNIEFYLHQNPLCFTVRSGKFISRAGLFTGKYFSIHPKQFEIEKHCLIVGHRCVPFANPDIHSSKLRFKYRGAELGVKTIEIESARALGFFSLFGDEYAWQYMIADETCGDVASPAADAAIPRKIYLTAVDLEPLSAEGCLNPGCRLLARVENWRDGIIGLEAYASETGNVFKQDDRGEKILYWYTVFDACMLECFQNHGPCSSIEEQLLYVFLDNNRLLCRKECGSIEEYLLRSKIVAIEPYGVESRLWKKNEIIPAVGGWSGVYGEEYYLSDICLAAVLSPDSFVLDAYLYDALFRGDEDVCPLMMRIMPDSLKLEGEERALFLFQCKERWNALVSAYNKFLDFKIGSVRRRVLELYSALLKLSCDLDMKNIAIEKLPNEPLIIMQQLFIHLLRILEFFVKSAADIQDEDLQMIDSTLDGMEYNFEEISVMLLESADDQQKDLFTVL